MVYISCHLSPAAGTNHCFSCHHNFPFVFTETTVINFIYSLHRLKPLVRFQQIFGECFFFQVVRKCERRAGKGRLLELDWKTWLQWYLLHFISLVSLFVYCACFCGVSVACCEKGPERHRRRKKCCLYFIWSKWWIFQYGMKGGASFVFVLQIMYLWYESKKWRLIEDLREQSLAIASGVDVVYTCMRVREFDGSQLHIHTRTLTHRDWTGVSRFCGQGTGNDERSALKYRSEARSRTGARDSMCLD